MRESRKPIPVAPVPFGLGLAFAISLLAAIYAGILPGRILRYVPAGRPAVSSASGLHCPGKYRPNPAPSTHSAALTPATENVETRIDKNLHARAS
jgi:hypothetical protein